MSIKDALEENDHTRLSVELDTLVEFQTVPGHDNSIAVGDHVIWFDEQDPNNRGWAWRRIGGGDEQTIDDEQELIGVLNQNGYLKD